MSRLVLGTAGHIDHGKTSLIKLLTGYDCDRLPEEKARGITIELGFTHLELPSGTTIGIVDVPGHERFIKTMVAGAGGIDFVMLIVAADEAVMPQTREHFAICRLLNLRHGLVALTKIDMVDEELIELAREDVAQLVRGSFLEGAPVVPVSSVTGAGREALVQAIEQVAAQIPSRPDSGILRLPVDRVFTMRGFGTVVTGTCIGGRVAVGDEIEILPTELRAKVRGLQVHGQPVEVAYAGQRTAVNLQGIELEQAPRGSVLATPGMLSPTYMIDVELTLESDAPRPLKRRSLVRLYSFTREALGFAVPLSVEQIEPGQSAKAQLRLQSPIIVLPGDRVVLRSYSPMMTIGGGVVLNSHPYKHRAPYTEALADLALLHGGDLLQKMTVHYRQAGRRGLELARLGPLLGVAGKSLREAYQTMLSKRQIVRLDSDVDLAIDAGVLAEIKKELIDALALFHQNQPAEPGLNRAELANRFAKGSSIKVINKVLSLLVNDGQVALDGSVARLAGHQAVAGDELQQVREKILEAVRRAGFAAPTYKELQEAAGTDSPDQALSMLVREGRLMRIGGILYYDPAVLAEIERLLVGYLEKNGEIDAQGLKNLLNISRKWTIPLGEHFDAARLTLRVGDKRVLRRKTGE